MKMADNGSRSAVQDLDLLTAAWGLAEVEVEGLLRVPEGSLAAWRNASPAVWSEDIATQVEGLKRLQDAIWLHHLPTRYAAFWRRPWSAGSPIGQRTPLLAITEGGASTVALITRFLRAAGLG